MFFCFKNHFNRLFIVLFIILAACQLQEPTKNHGIVFLENRSNKLIRLNTELFNIIEAIKSKSNQLNVDNEETTDYLSKGKLIQIRRQLLNERSKLNTLQNNSNTNMAIIEKNINKVNNIKLWHNILAGSSLIAIFYLLNKII